MVILGIVLATINILFLSNFPSLSLVLIFFIFNFFGDDFSCVEYIIDQTRRGKVKRRGKELNHLGEG